MKKWYRIPCFMLLFLCFAGFSVGAEIVTLRESQGQATMPFILVLNNGDLLVVFSEGTHFNSDADPMYTRYSQETKTWSHPAIAFKKTDTSAFIQLALDSQGDVHAIMMDGRGSSNREIYYTWYEVDKEDWKAKKRAYESPGVNSTWPRLQIEDDILYIVWCHNYPSSLGLMDVTMITNTVADAKAGAWPVAKGSRETISDMGQSASVHPFFGVKDKSIYCIWMDDNHRAGSWAMYYTEGLWNESSQSRKWEKAVQIFPSNAKQYYPALVLDNEGNVHVLYSNKNGPFWYARKSVVDGEWSPPRSISTGGASFTVILFAKFAHGLVHTVWRQTHEGAEALYYRRALPDGTWAKPIRIAENQQFPEYPVLDLDSKGNVHVVWSDGHPDSPRHIYYTKVDLPGKAPNAVIVANRQSGLLPLDIKFNAFESNDPDGKIIRYDWDYGDGVKESGEKLKKTSHTYEQEGTYTASLSVLDDDFRIDIAQLEITVNSGTPEANFEVSASSGMIPLTVNFDASNSVDFDGEIVSYDWNFGDGATASGVFATHTYTGGGKFQATLTVVDNDGNSGTETQQISVFQRPIAVFTASPVFGKPPLEVLFNASDSYDPDGEIESYKWDFGDGFKGVSRRVRHTFSTPGTFMVVLTVVDDDNVTGTTTGEIRVLDTPLAPLNITVETIVNRALLATDYINRITWEENPGNAGLFDIASYRLYRRGGPEDSIFILLAEVSSNTFSYEDRGLATREDASAFIYAVSAVDGDGNESLLSQTGTAVAIRNFRDNG